MVIISSVHNWESVLFIIIGNQQFCYHWESVQFNQPEMRLLYQPNGYVNHSFFSVDFNLIFHIYMVRCLFCFSYFLIFCLCVFVLWIKFLSMKIRIWGFPCDLTCNKAIFNLFILTAEHSKSARKNVKEE